MASDSSECVFRIHAIILTKDRPSTLARCVNDAIRWVSAEDWITILDDSGDEAAKKVGSSAATAASDRLANVSYVRASCLHELLAHANNESPLCWQLKTAPRDIAPLRNLELLLSIALPAQTTILIDDDIHSFDLQSSYDCMEHYARATSGTILGAGIGGITELDTLTRLSDAMSELEDTSGLCVESLFRARPRIELKSNQVASAGYLAFRLPHENLFAFPPGYNEDWLWCLLHGEAGTAKIEHAHQTVIHRPPEIRRSTSDDIQFELYGDLVLDCMSRMPGSSPMEILRSLRDVEIEESLLPRARVEALMLQQQRLESLRPNPGMLELLEQHGLSILRDLLRSGELDADGHGLLRRWCGDAIRKHESFAETMQDPATNALMKQAVEEGKL
ncbi:MAG: hypothetical protein RIC55_14100 [Pirellulaceae bacterium]